MALSLKGKDLASNKAVADRGVLIDQVCNANESRSCKVNLLTSWNSFQKTAAAKAGLLSGRQYGPGRLTTGITLVFAGGAPASF